MKITIEQLAEKLNATVWTKGDLKRIYLNDEGYNTKKMSTKTFIFQDENGDFKVSCRVECDSQPWQWCKSQEDQVKEGVYTDIENAIAQLNAILVDFKVVTEKGAEVMVYVKKDENAEPVWFTENNFYNAFGDYPHDVFPGKLPKIEIEQPTVTAHKAENKQPVDLEIKQDGSAPEFGIGKTVVHGKLGSGTVVDENQTLIVVNFPSIGETKKLIKKFAPLKLAGND